VTEKDLGSLIETGLKGLSNQIEQIRVEARETQIQIEGVRGDIKQLAEGITNVEEKLDRQVNENIRQFDDIRALMRVSYVQIEQRVSTLEDRYEGLNARLTALESTRH
jgi:predicted  nucleic acid-binding Zn-ribbon protein